MKKTFAVLSVVLPIALLFSMADASAQHRNSASNEAKQAHHMEEKAKDVKHKSDKDMKKHHKEMNDCKCKKDKKCDCMKKKHQKYANNEHIIENYNEAVERINKSSFDAKQKEFLLKQAQDSRDFAMQQSEARQKFMQMQMADRKSFGFTKENLKDNKPNRKAVKKIHKILFD